MCFWNKLWSISSIYLLNYFILSSLELIYTFENSEIIIYIYELIQKDNRSSRFFVACSGIHPPLNNDIYVQGQAHVIWLAFKQILTLNSKGDDRSIISLREKETLIDVPTPTCRSLIFGCVFFLVLNFNQLFPWTWKFVSLQKEDRKIFLASTLI
jgi:hypothetical protein